MTRLVAALGGLGLPFVLVACGPPPVSSSAQELIRRASFDLQCPSEQLRWTTIDESTQGVRGCRQQATYVRVCRPADGLRDGCTWISNDRR
ncbi:MAG: hypothetical protein K8H88_16500 [Sandaracinaceae bacterium]|nr:hypothetical protein [Sandaracinaceae bacterium]